MTDALHVRAIVLPEGEERDLYAVDGRVTYDAPSDATTIAAAGFVLPGLVDAHCHIGLARDGGVDEATQERQALADRDAGTLLARDCGVPPDTRWIDDRPDLPRIIRAGRHIARTRRYLRNYGVEIEPDQLPDEAERQARRGNGWVKIVGDWIDRDEGDLRPCWPLDAFTAAVQRAHAAGARVTTHTFGEAGIEVALQAGVDCVEHATGASEPQLATMAAGGVAVVPTLLQIDNFPGIADGAEAKFPTYAAHMRALHARSRATVVAAHEAGVAVYAGTDAGGALPHGLIANEITLLAAAGLPADVALGAASWRARAWLGVAGTLHEGAPADFIVYDGDPRADISTLGRPVRIVLRGRVVA